MSDNFARAEALAQRFHETYERLAPSFGYRTREASAKPWAEVPEDNRLLMIAVCQELLDRADALALAWVADEMRLPPPSCDLEADQLLPPAEWEQVLGVKIIDPDGWRGNKPWGVPITLTEFQRRAMASTVEKLVPRNLDEAHE